jgi:hypothetical protein
MRIARTLLMCACLAGAGHATAQPVAPEKRAEIEHLLEVTGALAIGQQMSKVMVTHFAQLIRRENPNVPQHVIDAIPEEVGAVMTEGLPVFKEMIIPLYDKYFTLDDLRGLSAFYASPLGKKAITVMPALMQEGMQVGMRWGEAMGPRIGERMRARFKNENIKI